MLPLCLIALLSSWSVIGALNVSCDWVSVMLSGIGFGSADDLER